MSPQGDDCEYSARIEEAEKALGRGFLWLSFPADLERRYREDYRNEAARAFRYRSLFILFLYLLLSSGIYALMPESERFAWVSWYSWVGVIIVVASVLSRVPAMDRWFSLYAGLGSMLAVAFSVAITGFTHNQVANQLTHAAIMYAVVIIYSIVGLNLRTATLAGWSGGALGIVIAHMMGGAVDWDVAHRTYTGSSLMGMLICYLIEHGHRRAYLQARLLTLTGQRTEQYARQVAHLSRTDPLTGLSNRRHMDEVMDVLWRRARREQFCVAALMIDVDHFKPYNDHFGHLAGDQCLRKISAVLSDFAGRPDDLAVRYGGEEFLLVLGGADLQAAQHIAQRVLEAVRELAVPMPDEKNCISVSIGVAAVVPAESIGVDALLHQADEALYQAKQQGRDRVVAQAPPLSMVGQNSRLT
ncbi:diguanylate cyclase [Alcanivorax sp. 1008]|uniref:GGDEF domain-containing protein n=1 Tax=Alcanivorax sp. 1008 TaxID=2816853 RepID=UPI001DF45F82|nr:GGDEF domain-containing protein [Alcanivorax sp. 1008]MCC1495590.1 GGDEF domain-containing protein [Alcanivorax sp. 1008]